MREIHGGTSEFLISVGANLRFIFNPKEKKTPLPARSQVILGRLFNSTSNRVTTANKRKKYRLRNASMLSTDVTTRIEVEKIHGCLNYVAEVEPFGRPCLAHLTIAMTGKDENDQIALSPLIRQSLKIWEWILKRNKGISMDFILKRIPQAHSNIFVDASTT